MDTAKVVWIPPTGKDNSKGDVNIYLKTKYGPNSKLTAGQYDITYGIKDNTGNEGRDCKFSAIVRGMQIYVKPFFSGCFRYTYV